MRFWRIWNQCQGFWIFTTKLALVRGLGVSYTGSRPEIRAGVYPGRRRRKRYIGRVWAVEPGFRNGRSQREDGGAGERCDIRVEVEQEVTRGEGRFRKDVIPVYLKSRKKVELFSTTISA